MIEYHDIDGRQYAARVLTIRDFELCERILAKDRPDDWPVQMLRATLCDSDEQPRPEIVDGLPYRTAMRLVEAIFQANFTTALVTDDRADLRNGAGAAPAGLSDPGHADPRTAGLGPQAEQWPRKRSAAGPAAAEQR